jgi:hypothetical protein
MTWFNIPSTFIKIKNYLNYFENIFHFEYIGTLHLFSQISSNFPVYEMIFFSNILFRLYSNLIKIYVKPRKDNTNTLNLVIHRVKFRKKKLSKKYISTQYGVKLKKPSMYPTYFLCMSISIAILYRVFIVLIYTIVIIPLEPCALNVKIQHFVLSFSISY